MSEGGTVMPSAWAALRLMTRLDLGSLLDWKISRFLALEITVAS